MVKNLLPANDVPESYVDAYDAVLKANDKTGMGISLTGMKNVLQSSKLSSDDQSRILNFVVPGGQENINGLGRSEFNVLLALIGLGQEGEDINLDGVDERRRSTRLPPQYWLELTYRLVELPEPKIFYIDQLHSTSEPSKEPPTPESTASPPKPRKIRQDSFGGDPTADPWASPAHKNIPTASSAAHTVNGVASEGIPSRMSNGNSGHAAGYTTHSGQDAPGDSPPTGRSSGTAENAWGGYNGSSAGFSDQATLGGGFGDSGDGPPNRSGHQPSRSVSASITIPPGTGESVTVTLLPEKEGMFLFQHHNYEVKTVRKGTSVVRRYSDFVWLLDCLQKRYPFRRLPLLPPKRVQGRIVLILCFSSHLL